MLVGGGIVSVGGGIVSVGMGGRVSVGGIVFVFIGIIVAACWDCDEGRPESVPCRTNKEVGVASIAGVVAPSLLFVEVSSPNREIRVATASSGLTGVISCCEQKLPVKVQARVNSSGERGSGADGGLIADVPLSPPRSMLVLCPAVTIWVCPPEVMVADPLYRLTSIDPF